MPNTKYYVSKEKLGLYDEKIKKYVSDADADILQAAKDHAEGLGSNYDIAGAAATAEANAKKYTDNKVAPIVTDITRILAPVDTNMEGSISKAVNDAKIELEASIQDTANDAASGIADLRDYIGTIPTTEAYEDVEDVIGYIDKKAIETLAAASGDSSETAASVKQQLDTYKASNDTKIEEIEGLVTGAQDAADDALAHSEGVAEDLADAIEALEGADADQVSRILTLEGQITGLSGAMHFKGVLTGESLPSTTDGYEDGDVVIFGNKEYVVNSGAFVEFGDVGAQAEAITALITRADGVDAKIEEIEGDISGLETEVGNKVAKTDYDAKIDELEEADTLLNGKVTILESKVNGYGDGTIADRIDAAKQAAINDAADKDTALKTEIEAAYKQYADNEDAKIETRVDALETASETYALSADLTALDGRVSAAEIKIGTLESEMDAVEAKAAANESAISTINTTLAGKAAQADLDSATGRIDTLETWQNAFAECSEDDINNLFI